MTDINPNNFFGPFSFSNLILWFLGVATLIGIIDYIGLMPDFIAKWIARNRLEAILKQLKYLNVRVHWDEKENTLSIIERVMNATNIKEPKYKIRLRHLLELDTYAGNVEVGETRSFSLEKFVDVMGGSTRDDRVVEYAKILNTYATSAEGNSIGTFDIVATPKLGSPILGYEFSKLVKKPLVLGIVDKVNDKDGKMGLHARMDYPNELSLKGKKILIVDDSTTGGRKISDLVEELRKAEAKVENVLVLFEPKGKGAREKLNSINLNLHAIIDGPFGEF